MDILKITHKGFELWFYHDEGYKNVVRVNHKDNFYIISLVDNILKLSEDKAIEISASDSILVNDFLAKNTRPKDDHNTTFTIEKIIKLGGNVWNKHDMKRVYINSAILNTITGAGVHLSDLTWKIYVDVPTGDIFKTTGKKPRLIANIKDLKICQYIDLDDD
jgi:hypothetical protein